MAGPNVPEGSIGSVLPINGGSDQQMSGDGGGSTSNLKNKFVNLCSLGLAHNQLGPSAGKALSLLIKENKRLTALDVSDNSLGFEGGLELAEALEKIYGVEARLKKKQIFDELSKSAFKRKRTKKVVYTSLIRLDMRRNGIGPAVVSSLMQVNPFRFTCVISMVYVIYY